MCAHGSEMYGKYILEVAETGTENEWYYFPNWKSRPMANTL